MQHPARQTAIAAVANSRSVGNDLITEVQFNRAPKKTNMVGSSTATSSSSASVQINIANYMPLNDIEGHRCVNMPAHRQQLTDAHTPSSPSGTPPIPPNFDYPSIRDVLEELNGRIPYLDMLQYDGALLDHGIRTVDDVKSTENDTLIAIGMPEGVLEIFRNYAMIMALSAEGYGVSAPKY
jgi:hypothetical protein